MLLPDIDHGFRIPRLVEKPQNPIVESLELWHRRSNRPLSEVKVDGPEPIPTEDEFAQEGIEELSEQNLWQDLLARGHAPAVRDISPLFRSRRLSTP